MAETEGNSERELPRHPVRLVAQRTGLSSHVLRAWERRYGVVAPTRTVGGQRLYTDADIERLKLLRTLVARGGAISQLAQLSAADLARRVEAEGVGGAEGQPNEAERELGAARWRELMLMAIMGLDSAGLRKQLERGVVALGVPQFLDRVVAPVLVEIGLRWRRGELGIVHEHMATVVIRQVLGWVRETAETGEPAPALVVATPPNQVHEGGAMLVAAAAAAEGWRVIYLGADLPPAEIAAAALRTRARAVALSVIHPPDDPTLGAHLRALRQALPAELPLLVGGAAAESYRGQIEAAEGEIVADLAELRSALGEMVIRA